MNDTDEWQKSEDRRRGGTSSGSTGPQPPGHDQEHEHHLTQEQVERIEVDVREDVAATDPAITDS